VRLRPGTRADIPALAALVREGDLSHRAWAGPALRVPALHEQELDWDLCFARAGAWVCVAQDGEEIVGVLAFFPAMASRTDRTPLPGVAHVSAVFVAPSHWRRGVARRLLHRAEEAMREQGYVSAQLWTLAGSPAESVYTALGWHADGRRDHHDGLGLDIVAYAKVIRT
jgi:GNAT superfamily N-acetyltransferase